MHSVQWILNMWSYDIIGKGYKSVNSNDRKFRELTQIVYVTYNFRFLITVFVYIGWDLILLSCDMNYRAHKFTFR